MKSNVSDRLSQTHAASAEANRQLSSAVYDAMYAAGLFTMLAPKAHGGLELHPVETMQVWEAVARIDASAAWNLVMNQAIAAYAAWLPAAGAQEVFRNGPPTVAGALNPPAAATPRRGGLAHHRPVPLWQWVPQRAVAGHAGDRNGRRPPEGGSGDGAAGGTPSGSFCRAPPRRFSTPGTPWACAARARPTMRCRTCLSPTT